MGFDDQQLDLALVGRRTDDLLHQRWRDRLAWLNARLTGDEDCAEHEALHREAAELRARLAALGKVGAK